LPHPLSTKVRIHASVTDPGGSNANNSAMQDVVVSRPDLSLAVTPSYVAFPRGGTTQLTAQVTSSGTASTPAPIVRRTGVGVVSMAGSGTGWSCSGSPVTCVAAAGLDPDASAPPLTINATAVNANAAGLVTATLLNGDYNVANDANAGNAGTVAIGDHPDLELTANASAAVVETDDPAFFTVSVRNAGTIAQTAGMNVAIYTGGLRAQPAPGGTASMSTKKHWRATARAPSRSVPRRRCSRCKG
jgi:hypothetical protein